MQNRSDSTDGRCFLCKKKMCGENFFFVWFSSLAERRWSTWHTLKHEHVVKKLVPTNGEAHAAQGGGYGRWSVVALVGCYGGLEAGPKRRAKEAG